MAHKKQPTKNSKSTKDKEELKQSRLRKLRLRELREHDQAEDEPEEGMTEAEFLYWYQEMDLPDMDDYYDQMPD